MYEYFARVTRVVDGDTFTADFDLGFGILRRGVKIRLANVDTPETFRPYNSAEREHGQRAKTFVKDRIEGRDVIIRTKKDKKGKYGRLVADVVFGHETDNEETLSELLVENDLIKLDRSEYIAMEQNSM